MTKTKKYHYTVRKTVFCEIDVELPYTETRSDDESEITDCPNTVIDQAEKEGFDFLCFEIIYTDENGNSVTILEGE